MAKTRRTNLENIEAVDTRTIQVVVKQRDLVRDKNVKVVQQLYEGNFRREDIQSYVNKHSTEVLEQLKKDHPDRNYLFQVSLQEEGKGWRYPGFMSKAGDIHLHSNGDYDGESADDDPDTYSGFAFYTVLDNRPNAGGADDKYNDCLYYLLKSILPPYRLPWPTPEKFKHVLGVGRSDPVPIDKMADVEKLLPGYKIIVTGDHQYYSNKNSNLVIKILLLDGHYKLNNPNHKNPILKSQNTDEKPIVIYGYDSEKRMFKCYNGTKYDYLTNDELLKHQKQHVKSPYLLIKLDKKLGYETQYKEFIDHANQIKKKSLNVINLFKTGTVKTTALSLFERFNKNIVCPDPILPDEAEWINKASFAALMDAKVGYTGEAHKYDIRSHYPSLFLTSGFHLPVKRGKFQTISELPDIISYGIYRVKIKNTKPMLFRSNNSNYYTHFDINRARDLKLKIQLIQDEKPNALVYDGDARISSPLLFKTYVEYLYGLKSQNIPFAKSILNTLWGALCQKMMCKSYYKDELVLKEDFDLMSMRLTPPTDTAHGQCTYLRQEKTYLTDFARFCPFIIGKGRFVTSKMMEPFEANIIRVHTDGFMADKKLDIKLGPNIGELKYEGVKNIKIVNKMKCEDF